jgi:small subunit ribosomal protein S4
MGRYIDPSCRQCRRIGEKLFLKGDRCYTPNCSVERRKKPPGDAPLRRRRSSDWAIQLREKQKARFTYGVLERQFRNYFESARDQDGATGDVLLQVLERRLDNVVFRLSFADSRKQARQLVNHGHFYVNDKKSNIPSYLVKPSDSISWKMVGDSVPSFIGDLTDGLPKRPVPNWLKLDVAKLRGEVLGSPDVADIDTGIESRLIVEFYSR